MRRGTAPVLVLLAMLFAVPGGPARADNDTPAAFPTPRCADRYAKVTQIFQPDVPIAAQELHAAGVAQVEVILDRDGGVVREWVARSSGWQEIDDAAVAAAARSKYQPEMFNCERTAGTYMFRITLPGDRPGVPAIDGAVTSQLRIRRRGAPLVLDCTDRAGAPMPFRNLQPGTFHDIPFEAVLGGMTLDLAHATIEACVSQDGRAGVILMEPSR